MSNLWSIMRKRSRARRLQLAIWSAALTFCAVLNVYVSIAVIAAMNSQDQSSPAEADTGSLTPLVVIAVVLSASLAAYVISGWLSRHNPVDPMLETDLTNDGSSEAWRIVDSLARIFAVRTPLLVIERRSPGGASVVQFHRFSKICVSPDLIEDASREEMEAVLAHEMSHIVRNDSLIGSFLRAGVMLSILTAGASVLAVIVDIFVHIIAGTSAGMSLRPTGLMSVCGLLAVLTVLFDFAAMRCQEHIADMDAATVTGRPLALISYLTRGEAATGKLFTPFCTHPSPIFRCIALSRLQRGQEPYRAGGAMAGTPEWPPVPIPTQ